MSENICSVCGEKFEDKYFDKEQNKCILHCDKKEWNNWSYVPKMKIFWSKINDVIIEINEKYKHRETIRNEIRDAYNDSLHIYKFEYIIFPKFGEHFISINMMLFDKLNKNIDIKFIECVFQDDVSFDLIHKARKITFKKCEFFSSVVFERNTFNGLLLFEDCTVEKNISFRNVVFNSTVSLIKSIFKMKLDFVHCRFNDSALLNLTEFNEFKIYNSYFRKEVNFLDLNIKILDRETARIIKDSFEKQNNIIEANKYYAIEMKEREKELSWSKNFLEKLVFSIHGWSSYHSQSWTLALFWIFIIGMFASYLNFDINSFTPPSFYNGLYKELFNAVGITILTYFSMYNFVKGTKTSYIFWVFLLALFFYWISTSDIYLNHFAQTINPFKNGEELTSLTLLFKIVLGYLIYQFIISIRQNTRRK